MQVRLFTVEEANALIPKLNALFVRLADVKSNMKDARDNLVDLRIIWGEEIEKPSCEAHQEYETYRAAFAQHEQEMQDVLADFTAYGCEIKDVDNGLVDFHARRGDEIVFLCWRRGEERVTAWHTHMAGYAGRRPLTEF